MHINKSTTPLIEDDYRVSYLEGEVAYDNQPIDEHEDKDVVCQQLIKAHGSTSEMQEERK